MPDEVRIRKRWLFYLTFIINIILIRRGNIRLYCLSDRACLDHTNPCRTCVAHGHGLMYVYWVFKHCAIELTPVVANLVKTMLQTGRPPRA